MWLQTESSDLSRLPQATKWSGTTKIFKASWEFYFELTTVTRENIDIVFLAKNQGELK